MAVAEAFAVAHGLRMGKFDSEHNGPNECKGSLVFANPGPGKTIWVPSIFGKVSGIAVVRMEMGYDNSEAVVSAAEEWNYHNIPVVISMREYDREPMFGEGSDQRSMFGLVSIEAYRFAKGELGGFRWCATPLVSHQIRKFYKRSRLIQVLDSAASVLSLPILHRDTR